MYDIMEHRVTLVEQLSKGRQPFPEMDVVYFIAPTKESAKLVAKDFDSALKAKYRNVHLFFSDTVSTLFSSIVDGYRGLFQFCFDWYLIRWTNFYF